jgi:hypothetical protein
VWGAFFRRFCTYIRKVQEAIGPARFPNLVLAPAMIGKVADKGDYLGIEF